MHFIFLHLKRSPGISRKSRVSYPSPGFLSRATWPSLPKKHYNGLNQTTFHTNICRGLRENVENVFNEVCPFESHK